VAGAYILTESQPRGYYTTAVVIEYDHQIDLRGVTFTLSDLASIFQVGCARTSTAPSTLGTSYPCSRIVVNAYSNDMPVRAATAAGYSNDVYARTATASKGKYLIVELSDADTSKSATEMVGGWRYPFKLEYSVTINANLLNRLGRIEVTAGGPIETKTLISPVVDDFGAGDFTGGQPAIKLVYRFFKPVPYLRAPKNPAHKYPLMVFLHGSGERGDNNVGQLVASMGATGFASPEFQAKHPSFIVAPQCPIPTDQNGQANWANDNLRDALKQLVDSLMAQYPIDPKRVYIQGLSMGASGTRALLAQYPQMWAGAIFCAGGLSTNVTPPGVEGMKVPAWITAHILDTNGWANANRLSDYYIQHGVDVAKGQWAGDQYEQAAPAAATLLEFAEENGIHVLFTTYDGTPVGQAHNTGWIATYSNPVICEWLFSQQRP
jgi:predicted peptidase